LPKTIYLRISGKRSKRELPLEVTKSQVVEGGNIVVDIVKWKGASRRKRRFGVNL
jgi:hypothetical protein